jgi:hypothetical protein
MKRLIAVLIGAVAGAVIGYTQVLCPGGQCALTGSWYGGAVIGGTLGLLFTGGG